MLDQIRERLAKATAGEWQPMTVGEDVYVEAWRVPEVGLVFICTMDKEHSRVDRAANADFIAHAPEDIGWLLAERDRQIENHEARCPYKSELNRLTQNNVDRDWVQPKNQSELLARLAKARDLAVPERERENLCACAHAEVVRLKRVEMMLNEACEVVEEQEPARLVDTLTLMRAEKEQLEDKANALVKTNERLTTERDALRTQLANLTEDHEKTLVLLRAEQELSDRQREDLKALPRWIPVTERVPDTHDNVLVVNALGDVMTGWCDRAHGWQNTVGKIIAWMPLPAPSEKEIQNG